MISIIAGKECFFYHHYRRAVIMLEQIHAHIVSELQQNTKTDIIFILSSILLNLIILAVNSGMAENSAENETLIVVMVMFSILLVIINLVAIIGLMKGRETRQKLLAGLIRMYEDQGVDKYYDKALMKSYSLRYTLFMLVVVFTGLLAISVPFILR